MTNITRSACLLLFAILCTIEGLSQAQENLPNILWITSEDNGPELGCYGDSYADTPNIDALAARGMLYWNAWSNAPVCAPARTTIITGMYPASLGAQHMRSTVKLPPDLLTYPQYLRRRGYYCTNNSKTDYNVATGKIWDESSGRAHWKNRREDQPFFAIFNFTTSHESRIRRRPHKQVHDPGKVRIPAYHPDTPEVRQDWAQYYDVVSAMDRQVGKALAELQGAGLAEETIVFYYGDHGSGMPRSKRWPYDSGLHVPMIVHVPEKWKHLAPADYQSGGKSNRLVAFVDLAPTVLSLAGIKPPAHMQGRAFLGRYAAEPSPYLYGFRGRMDERCDMVRTVRDQQYVYVRNYMPHRIYGLHVSYMFQTPTTRVWKQLFDDGKLNDQQAAFWRGKPAEELYDLSVDPDEVHNLAGSERHQTVLQRLRTANQEHLRSIRDLGFLPEYEIHQRAGDRSPWEMGQSDQEFPLDRIFKTAERASNLRPEETAALIESLNDEDSAVRYWSALGLLARGKKSVGEAREPLRSALADPAPGVRIAAAEALVEFGGPQDRSPALQALLQAADLSKNHVNVSILALNSIDELDDKAAPLHEALRALPVKPQSGTPARYTSYTARLKEKILRDLDSTPKP